MYVGRFAPSPTGRMHLGVARTSLAAWLDARAAGGRILLRIEDVDKVRAVPGAAEGLMQDLGWLGLDWDGEPSFQSAREAGYEDALARLDQIGRLYPCSCSRKEIALASSAPHGPEDEGPRYPGTCRAGAAEKNRRPSLRLRTEPGDRVEHVDRLYGPIEDDVHARTGDFVLKRTDGLYTYQLAVTADDLSQGVNQVVRGADLLGSTARQQLLRRLLDPSAAPFETLHVPLVLGPSGERLQKRDGPVSIAEHRAAGWTRAEVIGRLAASLGLVPAGTAIEPHALLPLWSVARLPRENASI